MDTVKLDTASAPAPSDAWVRDKDRVMGSGEWRGEQQA